METELAYEMLCFFKKLDDIISVKGISRALFSLFDLLTFEDGIDRLS